MKISKEDNTIDAVAEPGDEIDIRIEERVSGQVLYVDVNGKTILRIGHITSEVEVRRTE